MKSSKSLLIGGLVAVLAGCASMQTGEESLVENGNYSSRWPERLANRYKCDSSVNRQAQTVNNPLLYRSPVSSDVGMPVCDFAKVSWPVKIVYSHIDNDIREEWEYFYPSVSQNSIIGAFLEGPSPEQLRVTFVLNRHR